MLYIQNVSGLTIRDLHLTRQSPGATQGFVNRVDDKEVILGKHADHRLTTLCPCISTTSSITNIRKAFKKYNNFPSKTV